jgi:hypothetical protein
MESFEELKAIGYKNLNMAQRERYSELKAQFEKKEVAPEKEINEVEMIHDISKPSEEDRIARLEKMIEHLSSENSNLREETSKLQEGWAEYKPPKDQNKTATLKVYQKDSDSPAGLVIKLTTFKNNAFNEETRKNDLLIYNVLVRYDDGTTEDLKIEAVEFAKIQEIEKVEIVGEDRRILKKVDGFVPMPEYDKQKYPKRTLDGGSGFGRSIGSGQVPLEVFRVESTVTVKRKNGQEFQMEADYLNL